MHSAESTVMDTEKRNYEQFPGVINSMVNLQENHFHDIVKGGNKVFYPVKKDDIADIPVKKENSY